MELADSLYAKCEYGVEFKITLYKLGQKGIRKGDDMRISNLHLSYDMKRS